MDKPAIAKPIFAKYIMSAHKIPRNKNLMKMDDFFKKRARKNTMVIPENSMIKSVYCSMFLSLKFLNLNYERYGYFMNNLPNFVYTFKKDNDVCSKEERKLL